MVTLKFIHLKKSTSLVPLLYFIFLFSSCSINMHSRLLGTWEFAHSTKSKHVFLDKRKYLFMIRDTIIMFNESSSKYKIKEKNDTLWLNIYYKNLPVYTQKGLNLQKHKQRFAIEINGDYLTTLSYKSSKGPLKNHIDEYSICIRQTETPKRVFDLKKPKITYIFPKGFKGAAWIAFNQVDGEPPSFDVNGNTLLYIPENGLLQTTLKEDAFATADRHYKIAEIDENEEGFNPYKTFDKFDRIDSTCCRTNEYIAIMSGFNQEGRGVINEKIFGKPINGNVMTIFIGTYEEISHNQFSPW